MKIKQSEVKAGKDVMVLKELLTPGNFPSGSLVL